ncbi:MAG: hypothetical protein ACLSE7_14600, partial [Lachnospirales bacterium]
LKSPTGFIRVSPHTGGGIKRKDENSGDMCLGIFFSGSKRICAAGRISTQKFLHDKKCLKAFLYAGRRSGASPPFAFARRRISCINRKNK